MKTIIAKLTASLALAAAVGACWWYGIRSSTAAPLDLPTVLHGAPYLLDSYLADLASIEARKDIDGDGEKDPKAHKPRPGTPSGSSGVLGVKVSSFRSSNFPAQDCFPVTNGWDRYYSTQYFGGPNTKNIQFPNTGNVASVTINTFHPSNGTTLATGIVIIQNGTTNKVCATNAGPLAWPDNPNLSEATVDPTQTNWLYRVTIFYKSSTAGGLSNIFFNWSYP